MEIERITLKNYRQYRDVSLDLGKSARGLTILVGGTGAGKTNLLNAITWCLYGKELHLTRDSERLPLLNVCVLADLQDKTGEVKVELRIKDEEGKKILTRTQKFSENREWSPEFKVLVKKNGDWKVSRNPELERLKILPEVIEEYFFFDGERLDGYFKTSTADITRGAIFKISQLEIVETAIRHLQTMINTMFISVKDYEDTENLKGQLETLSDVARGLKDDISSLREKKTLIDIEYDENEKKYRDFSTVATKQARREAIDREISEVDTEARALEAEKFDLLLRSAPIIGSLEAVRDLLSVINDKEAKGEVPPQIHKILLQRMLDENRCICGTNLSRASEQRHRIEKLLDKYGVISELSSELPEVRANLQSSQEEIKDFEARMTELNKKIQSGLDKRRTLNEELKVIEEEIKGSDIGTIGLLESRRNDLKQESEELVIDITNKERDLYECNKRIDEFQSDITKELKKKEKHEDLTRKVGFCRASLGFLDSTKEEIIQEIRKQVERQTKDRFLDIIWKKETYTDLQIDDRFSVRVLDKYGHAAMGTLSAGERQALALAFMVALNSVSGFEAPIIIDTPLGRLAGETRVNLAKTLPKFLKGKQVIVLATDTEYTEAVRKELVPAVVDEYALAFDEAKSEVKVVPYAA